MEEFSGRIAVLTGAGGGIGSALLKMLTRKGFGIVLVGRNEKKLRAAAMEAGCGANTLFKIGDLMDQLFLENVIPDTIRHFGRLDLLVNNAGICIIKPMAEITYPELDAIMKTNVYAPYILSRDAIEPLKKSDCATIINIGSVVSYQGYPEQSAYSATKHALLGMSKALAAETYKDGIRIHVLCPGGVDTGMAGGISHLDRNEVALISPDDIADVAEFLLTHRTNMVIDEIQMHRVGKKPF